MFFQAETNGIQYEISVRESRTHWFIEIQKEDQKPVLHTILKSDYQYMNKTISFIYKNKSYLVDIFNEGMDYTIYTRNSHRILKIYNEEILLHESLKKGGTLGSEDSLFSGMPGKIVKLMVQSGEKITKGQPLLIMEAMKMENEIRATRNTVIKQIHVKVGDTVEGETLLITFQ